MATVLVTSQMLSKEIPSFALTEINDVSERGRQIGTITEKGFELNLDNMVAGKKYVIVYDGSKYEVMKNEENGIELYEIG